MCRKKESKAQKPPKQQLERFVFETCPQPDDTIRCSPLLLIFMILHTMKVLSPQGPLKGVCARREGSCLKQVMVQGYVQGEQGP